MKNLTLRIDEKTLAEARKRAALEGTTVAKLVREFLQEYAAGKGEAMIAERLQRLREFGSGASGFAEPPAPFGSEAALERIADRLLTLEDMTTATDDPPDAGHDEWFRRQVQKALDDKKSGKSQYEDFDKVAAKFGFNAR